MSAMAQPMTSIFEDPAPPQSADAASAHAIDAEAAVAPPEDTVVGSLEEQQLQREAMEHQLRGQRGALNPAALHEQHIVPGAAPTGASEPERVRGETLSEEQLLSYRGKLLLAAEGDEIGPISSVYLDDATAVPKWIVAQVGSLMGSKRVVVPVFGSYSFRDAISVPYSREVILGAEVVGEGALTPEQDSGLYLHFGIPVSTELSPSGLPAGLHPASSRDSGRLEARLARNARQVGERAMRATRRVGRWRWPWSHPA
jgi:hypothetical protein